MGRFSFDKHGNIVPYELHPVSIAELEEEFVQPFTKSSTRKNIVEGHSNYVIEIFQILEVYYLGSHVDNVLPFMNRISHCTLLLPHSF